MDLLKKIGIGVGGLIAVLLVVGFILPRNIAVDRSVVIAASPDEVFPYVNSLKEFNRWSPWAEHDPNTVYSFSGPESGTGMRMTWESDHPNVGSGAQEIVESVAPERVRVVLDFGDQGTADAQYTLTAVEGGTQVTWGFESDMGMNPIGRYMGLMMDKWVGGDYEKGLAKLKDLVESS